MGHPWLPAVLFFIVGLFHVAILPLGYQFAVELTFPAGHALLVGVMPMLANLFSIVLAILMTMLLADFPGTGPALASGGLSMGLGLLASFFVRERLKKSEYENSSRLSGLMK